MSTMVHQLPCVELWVEYGTAKLNKIVKNKKKLLKYSCVDGNPSP
jgi:hypothetical protein